MNLREAFHQTTALFEAGNSVILEGPPGVGKTELMRKLAGWMKTQYVGMRVGVSGFFMATQSPIGITGLPWKGERVVEWNGAQHRFTVTDPAIPGWFMATDLDTGEVRPAALFDRVLLVIEEWGQGDLETKRAGAELFLNGGTPPYYLPPGSHVIALTNVDSRDGVTKEFDFVINRRCRLTVESDVRVWVEDFADKSYTWHGKTWSVLPVTKVWALQNPQIFSEPKPEKQGPWCTPRSLTAADRYTQVMMSRNGGILPLNDKDFMAAYTDNMSGIFGMPAAASYVSTLMFQLEIPSYGDVVGDPAGTPVPSKIDLQMMMAYHLAGQAKQGDLPALVQYMSKQPGMPKDLQIAFVSSMLRRDANLMMEPALQTWINKNAALVGIIGSLSQ